MIDEKPAPALEKIVTQSGRAFWLRPIGPNDHESFVRLFAGLDIADRRFRFFAALNELPERLVTMLTEVDHDRHEAFVALPEPAAGAQTIAGVVRLVKDATGGSAEFAITVASSWRGFGLGYSLMQYVIDYARRRQVGEVTGDVLIENKAMLQMCEELGFQIGRNPDDPSVATVRYFIA